MFGSIKRKLGVEEQRINLTISGLTDEWIGLVQDGLERNSDPKKVAAKDLFGVIKYPGLRYGAIYAAFANERLAKEGGVKDAEVVPIGDFKGSSLVDTLVRGWVDKGKARPIIERIWQFLKNMITSKRTAEVAA